MSRMARMGLVMDILRHWHRPGIRPSVLGYDVTYRCNQRCRYCGVPERGGDELDTAGALAHLGRFVEAGLRFCALGGAEPLVRDDIIVLATFLKRHGVAVDLNTNGALLPRRREILGVLDGVAVSYDGPEALHDANRGHGSHAAVLAAIAVAREARVPVRLTCTLSSANVGAVDAVLDFCRRERLPIRFQPVNPIVSGDGKRFQWVAPDPEAMRDALARIRHARRFERAPILNSRASLDYFMAWPDYPRAVACSAGRLFCRMDPAGAVYACTGRQDDVHVPLADHGTVREALVAALPGDCDACRCGANLEMNLLIEGGVKGILREAPVLLRWSR
jgi:MoaA/NifB/PqqE/SkfB family radical SAM enzyme